NRRRSSTAHRRRGRGGCRRARATPRNAAHSHSTVPDAHGKNADDRTTRRGRTRSPRARRHRRKRGRHTRRRGPARYRRRARRRGFRKTAGSFGTHDTLRALSDFRCSMNAQTPAEHNLAELIVSSLNLENRKPEDIDPDAPLFGGDLGLDSIDALELALAI